MPLSFLSKNYLYELKTKMNINVRWPLAQFIEFQHKTPVK